MFIRAIGALILDMEKIYVIGKKTTLTMRNFTKKYEIFILGVQKNTKNLEMKWVFVIFRI